MKLSKALLGLAICGIALAGVGDLRRPVDNPIGNFTRDTQMNMNQMSRIVAACSSLVSKHPTNKSTTIALRDCINALSNGRPYTVAVNGRFAEITPTATGLVVRTWGSPDEEEIVGWWKERRCNRWRIGIKITWRCRNIWHPIYRPSIIHF